MAINYILNGDATNPDLSDWILTNVTRDVTQLRSPACFKVNASGSLVQTRTLVAPVQVQEFQLAFAARNIASVIDPAQAIFDVLAVLSLTFEAGDSATLLVPVKMAFDSSDKTPIFNTGGEVWYSYAGRATGIPGKMVTSFTLQIFSGADSLYIDDITLTIIEDLTEAVSTAREDAFDAKAIADQLSKDMKGYVLIRNLPDGNEILIMDDPDPTQAVQIWRFNLQGLGFSNNVIGADNTLRSYSTAITMDGWIMGNFIKANTVTADKFTSGTGAVAPGNLALSKGATSNAFAGSSALPTDGTTAIGSTTRAFGTGTSDNNGPENSYLQIDLGAVYRIGESRVYFRADDTRNYWYKIKYSIDGVNWYYAVGIAGNTGWMPSVPVAGGVTINPTTDSFTLPISARYVRLYANGNNVDTSNEVYEWELYSTGVTRINGGTIETNSITANKLVTNTITAASGVIADAAITTAKIADLQVTGAKIANATITDANIGSLNAGKITAGTMSAARIMGGILTLGGGSNGNGTLIINDATGFAGVVGDNLGLHIMQKAVASGSSSIPFDITDVNLKDSNNNNMVVLRMLGIKVGTSYSSQLELRMPINLIGQAPLAQDNGQYINIFPDIPSIEIGGNAVWHAGTFDPNTRVRNDGQRPSATDGSILESTLKGGSIRYSTNTTGSVGYPTSFGGNFHFDAASIDRSFDLWKRSQASEWYLRGFDTAGASQGWQKLWTDITLPVISSSLFYTAVKGSTTPGTATYATRRGHYTQIGKLVVYQFYLNISAFTGQAGNLTIDLPLPTLSTAGEQVCGSIFFESAVDFGLNVTHCGLSGGPSQSFMTVYGYKNNGARVAIPATAITSGVLRGYIAYICEPGVG